MEIFTISGPPADGVEVLGESPDEMFRRLQAERSGKPFIPGPKDKECAQQVKWPLISGSAAKLGAIGGGLYGVYKTIKPGNRATGVTVLAGSAVMWGIGHALMLYAMKQFDLCRRVV